MIAADLPGSGRSGPQPRDYRPGYHESDARAFIALAAQLQPGPIDVIGYSDGGEIALLVAALAPGLVRSVVTWGAQGHGSDPGGIGAASFRKVVDDPDPGQEDYRAYLIATYGAETARAMTRSFADAVDAIVAAGGDISLGMADRILCPVLLIVGEHDPFNTKAQADAFAARARQARTVEAAGAGHGVHEDRPDWFIATVLDFLASRP